MRNKHHIIPTSIGGPEYNPENQYLWNKQKHEGYHKLFWNSAPSIVIKIIEGLTDADGSLNKKLISRRDLKIWQKVFGEKKPAEVIEFIKEKFLPVEEKYLRDELPELGGARKKRT